MAMVKKKKREFGAKSSSTQTSSLRPRYTPKTPPCTYKCPASVDIRGYVMHMSQSELYGRTLDQSTAEAWYMLTDKNPFPGTTGRVCPHPCESECNRGSMEGPLNINNIERYMGDYGINNNLPLRKLTEEKRPESVAIVGAGPAGLSCAYHLARRGADVIHEGIKHVHVSGHGSEEQPDVRAEAIFRALIGMAVERNVSPQP